MTDKPTIHEAIDACRLGDRDLSLPEMAELAQKVGHDSELKAVLDRSLAWDATVADAIQEETDVPVGLEARLLAAIDAADAPDQQGVVQPQQEDGKVQRKPSPPVSRRRSLRWIAIASGLAACLCVAVFAAVMYPVSVDVPTMIKQARDWAKTIRVQPFDPDVESSPRDRYPVDSSILVPPTGWQRLKTEYDRNAVVYDLRSNIGEPMAALIVVRTSAQFDVDSHLPMKPHSDTGGLCIAACQKNGFLYILILEGNERSYKRLIKAPTPVM